MRINNKDKNEEKEYDFNFEKICRVMFKLARDLIFVKRYLIRLLHLIQDDDRKRTRIDPKLVSAFSFTKRFQTESIQN